MTTESPFVTALVKEFGYPAWWFEVALGSRNLGHKASTANEALQAFQNAPDESIEKAGAYARYSQIHKVHESQVDDIWIRHWAYYTDFYKRLEKTTTTDEVRTMLSEQGVVVGSPIWDEAVKQLIALVRDRTPVAT